MGGVFKKAFGPIKISLLYEHCAFLQPFFCSVFLKKLKKSWKMPPISYLI